MVRINVTYYILTFFLKFHLPFCVMKMLWYYIIGHFGMGTTQNYHFFTPPLTCDLSKRLDFCGQGEYPYHNPATFGGYQNPMKLCKRKKQRPPKIGPDGIPCKRKSREGTTTYLWEFLLKLLQVIKQIKDQNTKPFMTGI